MSAFLDVFKDEAFATILSATTSAIVSVVVCLINNRHQSRLKRSDDRRYDIEAARAAFSEYLSAAEQYAFSGTTAAAQAFHAAKSSVLIYAPSHLHEAISDLNNVLPNLHAPVRGYQRSDAAEVQDKINAIASELSTYCRGLSTQRHRNSTAK